MHRSTWEITVEDTGIGIPEEDKPYIFNRRYRAKNVANLHTGGSGIGLMIIRSLVTQLRGKITFRSEVNKGTVFRLIFKKLPSSLVKDVREDQDILTGVTEQAQDDRSRKNVVLIVEDDEEVCGYLEKALADYTVIKTDNGNKALLVAREENPDVIISDVLINGLQGDELCRILKSSVETSHIPVILLTAISAREAIVHGLEAGANDYIIKPFDPVVLKARLKSILNQRQELRDHIMKVDSGMAVKEYASQMDKDFLNKAMTIMNSEMSNSDFSVTDLSRRMAVSRTVLYNKMKTLSGHPPNDFIRIVRLNKAKELLESHQYLIGEVSDMVGFSDSKYFSVSFKKQYGISPNKYKNQ
ncbi:MAG: response regulator [Candidatus Cryptobacteroides sp.]